MANPAHRRRLHGLLLLGAALAMPYPQPAHAAQPVGALPTPQEGIACDTVNSITRTNRGVIKEAFRLEGTDARMFLAADPALLDYVDQFQALMAAKIDELVVWRAQRTKTIGMAVPFAAGCAVPGYGEPDLFDKIQLMRGLVAAIDKAGLDDPDVRRRVTDLATYRDRAATGRILATPAEVEHRVDTLLARIAQARTGGPPSEDDNLLAAALSASAEDLASGFLVSRNLVEVLGHMQEGMRIVTPDGAIDAGSAQAEKQKIENRLSIYRRVIQRRGFKLVRGTYSVAEVSPECAASGSMVLSGASKKVFDRIDILGDGFELTLKVHLAPGASEGAAPAQSVTLHGAVVESTVVVADLLNSDYFIVGQSSPDRIVLKPAPDVLESWPSWASPPRKSDLEKCTLVLRRAT